MRANVHRGLLVSMSAAGSYGIAQELGGPFTGPLFWMIFTVCMLIGYTLVITYKPPKEKRTVYDDFGHNNHERFMRRMSIIKKTMDELFESATIRDAKGKFVTRKDEIVVKSEVFIKLWDIADHVIEDTYVPDDRY